MKIWLSLQISIVLICTLALCSAAASSWIDGASIPSPDIFKYMSVLLPSSVYSGTSPWPLPIIFNRNCSSSASVCCGSIVTKIWIQIKPLKNSLSNSHQYWLSNSPSMSLSNSMKYSLINSHSISLSNSLSHSPSNLLSHSPSNSLSHSLSISQSQNAIFYNIL